MLASALWPADTSISISFLDGSEALHLRIRAVAEQWLRRTGARLGFQWRPVGAMASIRISFRYSGSWAELGKLALQRTEQSQPTMNFGWLGPTSSDLEVQEVVLHEFGHALGMIHEHSSPEAQVPWDRKAVLAELQGPPNRWSLADIEDNVLLGYDRSEVRTTPFDPSSIMLYPIPAAWTAGLLVTTNNTQLSPSDLRLVREIYA